LFSRTKEEEVTKQAKIEQATHDLRALVSGITDVLESSGNLYRASRTDYYAIQYWLEYGKQSIELLTERET